MDKAKIHFRCDGGPAIGLGHLTRSLALAQMLDSLFEIHFHCIEAPESFVAELQKLNYIFHLIKNENVFKESITQGDITVIDHYGIGVEIHQKIREKGALVVCIDDLHDKAFDADLIINHAPRVKAANYQAQPYTQFALGPEYALLRPEFLEAARQTRKIDKIDNVLICFGGSDYLNITCKVLETLFRNQKIKNIDVVIGVAYAHQTILENLVKHDSRVQIHSNLAAHAMLKLMQKNELAIVPASSILYEVLSAGMIAACGYFVDNQKNMYEGFVATKTVIDLGNLKQEIPDLNFDIFPTHSQKIIDGTADVKLKKIFKTLSFAQSLSIREANQEDTLITYQWASDPEIRKFSFQTHTITKTEHENWFSQKLIQNNCCYLILAQHNNPVGSIRFDISNDEALISYLVAPEYQGNNLGIVLLTEGIKFLCRSKHTSNFKTIVGYVMTANIPSIKAFDRLGFASEKTADRIKFYKENKSHA